MTQPITEQEKSDMRDILSKFYGSQTKNWRISIDTFKVLETLINKTKACDRMMDLVPRPFGGGSVVKWGQKQVRQFVLRKLKSNEGNHYIICMKVNAASMRTDFYMSGASHIK
ncbi:MAG: hypothetical protein L3J88_02895 [Gammaproteobacteria bacterium]|nr:hypothetical protein [Gammaproteobacteria bacterium]MCF6362301.1 hypothetical protein [Gammaproteobacteria bacterium]